MSEVPESVFRSTVEASAADNSRIAKAVVNGFFVGLEIFSASKKERWSGSFRYDPETDDAEYRSDYRDSSQVRIFINDVRRRLRQQGY